MAKKLTIKNKIKVTDEPKVVKLNPAEPKLAFETVVNKAPKKEEVAYGSQVEKPTFFDDKLEQLTTQKDESYNERMQKIKDERKVKNYIGSKIDINSGYWRHKTLIGTAVTGLVRIEWAMARFGQIIPTNWSALVSNPQIPTYAPVKYLIADAQNLIVKYAVEQKVEWLFLIEHDNVLPEDCFLRMNEYMRNEDVPVVSGLYFTKSVPPEPMIYRGVGNSFYQDWKLGDKVWATGVPTGCVIIHGSLINKMWEESPEYVINGVLTRRVFETPEKVWFDPQSGGHRTNVGTSDLTWCNRVMQEGFLEKAGWSKYAKMENPFLVDTNIFCKQVDENGVMFPIEMPQRFLR